MNIGIDIDGTLDRNPGYFRRLMAAWAVHGERYLITARPATERLITLKHLDEMGINPVAHYDGLLMYPEAYLFDFRDGKPHFLVDDSGIEQYRDMAHRQEVIDERWKLFPDNGPLRWGADFIVPKMAQWKVEVCRQHDVEIMYDDNTENVKQLREAGLYVMHVCRDFGSKGGNR